jgi:nucleotide-binding universal stress UspA family protein
MFESCLICTEFSDGLERLAQFVPSLAKGGLKKIVFLHCIPVWESTSLTGVDPQAVAEAEARLSPALAAIPAGVEVKIEISSDRPGDVVPSLVKTHGIEVILVGAPFRSGLEEKLSGSTALGISQATAIPVMIFRPQFFSIFTQEELSLRCANLWRSLLIPYNGDGPADYLVEQLKVLVTQAPPQSKLRFSLLTVVESTGRKEILATHRQAEAREKLETIQAELENLGVETQIAVEVGDSIEEVFRFASHEDVNAIAIATLYQKNIFDWTVPKLNEEMLRRSWLPLLFLSPKK